MYEKHWIEFLKGQLLNEPKSFLFPFFYSSQFAAYWEITKRSKYCKLIPQHGDVSLSKKLLDRYISALCNDIALLCVISA